MYFYNKKEIISALLISQPQLGAYLSQNNYVAQWALCQQTFLKHKGNSFFFLNKIYGTK